MSSPAPATVTLGRGSLGQRVQDSIKALILERGLGPGDPMPTEFELAGKLGVSRNSVREATKVLEAIGIVVIRRGAGMYVGDVTLDGFVEQLEFHGNLSKRTGYHHLKSLLEIRELLETGLVDHLLSMGSATAVDIATMELVIVKMEAEAAKGHYSSPLDSAFHRAHYAELGNPLVDKLLNAFWTIFNRLEATLPPTTESPEEVARKHRRILEAVKAGDRAQAGKAMVEHFAGIHQRLDIACAQEGPAGLS